MKILFIVLLVITTIVSCAHQKEALRNPANGAYYLDENNILDAVEVSNSKVAKSNKQMYLAYVDDFIETCSNQRLTPAQKKVRLIKYVQYAKREIEHQHRYLNQGLIDFATGHLDDVQTDISTGNFRSSKLQAQFIKKVLALSLVGFNS